MDNEIEVLEIGADGAFDITSTKPVKQKQAPAFDENAFPTSPSKFDDLRVEALSDMKPGEYKVYKSEGYIFVLVKLVQNESVRKVGYENSTKKFFVDGNSNKCYTIPVPESEQIKYNTGSCTTWQDICSLRYEVV